MIAEPQHCDIKPGIMLHTPDHWERQLAAGGGERVKTEHPVVGCRNKSALASPIFGCPAFRAGGDEENRTPVRKPIHTTFFVDSLLFGFPFIGREQTRSRYR